ncbi:MAG: hypothetical protein ACFFAO_18005 [Candidatus Hermodarchaeota archaeon]
MIICGNCGAINNENEGKFCRKCGALLPISTRPPRIKIPIQNSKNVKIQENKNSSTGVKKVANNSSKIQNKTNLVNRDVQIFTKKKTKGKKVEHSKLEEIPVQTTKNSDNDPKVLQIEDIKGKKKGFLKEIPPQPFDGSIISSKKVYGPPKSELSEIPQEKDINKKVRTISKPAVNESISKEVFSKQKQLENDMSNVLAVLSKKLSIDKTEKTEKIPQKIKKPEEKIPPASLEEILGQLLKLDPYIQGSALIKDDGTILASALAHKMSDSLLATIGQNLSIIGSDILEGLSGGRLKSISIRGSENILDIAPIDKKNPQVKDMILIIFSHNRVKSGIISFAVGLVKKQIKEYLGI